MNNVKLETFAAAVPGALTVAGAGGASAADIKDRTIE